MLSYKIFNFINVTLLWLSFKLYQDSYIVSDILCINRLLPEMFDSLFQCDSIRKQSTPSQSLSCTFCGIVESGPNPIIRETDQFLVFEDRDPSAAQHLLIIPKFHIGSADDLTISDLPMLQQMVGLANELFDDAVLGFHLPPFTSVDHLHLHVIKRPFKSFWRGIKYPADLSVPWFISAQNLIKLLEDDKRSGSIKPWNQSYPFK